jgi:hypothetical protein
MWRKKHLGRDEILGYGLGVPIQLGVLEEHKVVPVFK